MYQVYAIVGSDGYPPEWHAEIKHAVRAAADHRCLRCGHPYRTGAHGKGEWTPCDEHCRHGGPVRWSNGSSWQEYEGADETIAQFVEARWRILTVHHLDGDKANCMWWNLVALCQRCHLTIQGRVKLEREFIAEHSEWFKIYAAGWYAWKYEQRYVDRAEAEQRIDELLAYEQRTEPLFR